MEELLNGHQTSFPDSVMHSLQKNYKLFKRRKMIGAQILMARNIQRGVIMASQDTMNSGKCAVCPAWDLWAQEASPRKYQPLTGGFFRSAYDDANEIDLISGGLAESSVSGGLVVGQPLDASSVSSLKGWCMEIDSFSPILEYSLTLSFKRLKAGICEMSLWQHWCGRIPGGCIHNQFRHSSARQTSSVPSRDKCPYLFRHTVPSPTGGKRERKREGKGKRKRRKILEEKFWGNNTGGRGREGKEKEEREERAEGKGGKG